MKALEKIIECLKQEVSDLKMGNLKDDSISDQDSFVQDFGLDSLDYAQVVLAGEAFVQVKLDENTINWRNMQTIASLAQALYERQS